MATVPQRFPFNPTVTEALSLARLVGLAALVAVAVGTAARADDWPTYRHDVARSGVTAEQLDASLAQCWALKPLFGPQPGWGDPKPDPVEGILELRRVHFDDVFQPVIAGGAVYFGSSADNKVTCVDLKTGRVRWTAITGGPIRLAPTVAGGRVYVGSDDGWAWCLDAKDGSVVWRFHAAPEDRRVLGHGRMISLWPLRSGILVDRGVAYLAAGIFPAEGVFFYAVDAATGKQLWCNDTCGEQPQSRISPQGYLLASETTLYAPMGRVSPAAFSRADGRLEYLTYFGKPVGGTYALLAGEHVYTGTEEMVAFNKDSRDRFATFAGRRIVVTGPTAYLADGAELVALDRKAYPAASRKLYAAGAQRTQASRALATSRRQQKTLEDAVKETTRGIQKVTAEITRLTKQGKAALPELNKLKAQERQLSNTRAARVTDLVAETDRYLAQQNRAAALGEKYKQAQAEVAAAARWKTPCQCDDSLILAGNLLVAGGEGEVIGVEATSGKKVFGAKVEGTVKGLAAAGGRLVASTDKGMIYCFGPEGAARHGTIAQPVTEDPYAGSPHAATFRQAAETILAQTGIKRGYCLVLGCETGQLALELARRSDLMIYAVSPDGDKVAAARKALDAAGLYGGRVCVEQWPLDKVPYSDYFANLVVSETAMVTGQLPPAAQTARMLKPLGGTVVIGQPHAEAGHQQALTEWLAKTGLPGAQVVAKGGLWATAVRGPLAGAGSWTHQYANPANTACGDDQRVKCPLGVLWFGSPGPGRMVNRHARAAAPLSMDGRLFVQGENTIMAYDAYNGLSLWQRDIPGAMRTNASHDGGNLAICPKGLLLAIGEECLRLDPATGKTLATYKMPPDAGSGRWGYLAVVGNLIYGSRGLGAGQSSAVFAVEIDTGNPRWVVKSDKQIQHTAIAIADGRFFLIDSNVTPEGRKQAVEEQRRRIQGLPEAERAEAEQALAKPDVRLVVALDAATGQPAWQKPVDLTHCGGGNIHSMAADGVLAIFGVYLDGHYWRQFFAGEFAARRVTALAASDGKFLWSRPVGYRVRPLIVGDTLHAEPWSFDLHTGQPRTRVHPVTGLQDQWQFARPGHHCGCPAASPNCLFFRSYCLGYYDLGRDGGTMHFGAQRPGCWINFIPAGGLLLMPEASAGCMCPFPNMCSVAFQPVEKNKAYAYYSAPGPMTPVRRLAIDFGAAGDRTDAAGNLWLAYPRPGGSLVLQFKTDVSFFPGGGFAQQNSAYTQVAGTPDPWLYATAARGLRKCVIPLLEEGDGAATYRVRLALADLENSAPGKRVFDVKLQGKVVAENLDVVAEAGGPGRALIKEFAGIPVAEKLQIELVPKASKPAPEQAPILQGVEIVRQRVTSLGCAVPRFLLSNLGPKQAGSIQLANMREEPFEGTLQVAAPQGFQVTPQRAPVKLAAGGRQTIAVEATVAEGVAAGKYEATLKLLRSDGTVEAQRRIGIEHLGRRGRLVLHPVEDTYVSRRYPTQNKGTATVLLVDGGSGKMGDEDHSLALLKFKLDVPGKPVSARLRIHNAGNPTGGSGRIRLVTGPWSETQVSYSKQPELGAEVARLGAVSENQIVDCPLKVELSGKKELSLAIDPTTCDGVDYLSREGGKPAELVVEYEVPQ